MPDGHIHISTRPRWEVLKMFHSGALIIVATHRSRRVAEAHAALRDAAAVLSTYGGRPDHHYDTRAVNA